jgi:predicted nucleic acid-binding protein
MQLQVPSPLPVPHLVDSTVWSKARAHPDLTDWFNAQVRDDLILVCDVVILELLRSAPNTAAFRKQAELLETLRSVPIRAGELARARQVQGLLAARGHHRGVPPTDLLIAAASEAGGVPLLHYDHDYELISAVTGQATRWVVPRGSLE